MPGNGSTAHSYKTLGEALRALGNLSEAEAAYRTALKLKSDYPEAWNNLGSALQQQNRSADALDALQRALALRPEYFRAYLNLGMVHLAQGDAPAAEKF